MKDNVNILCLKGFVNIDKINKNYVYINKNNELTTVIHNMKHFDNNFDIKLATGTSLRLHHNAILTGTIFESGLIKNNLDTDLVSNFKIDDYVYTPFKDLESTAIKDTVRLINTPKKYEEYFNTDLKDYCDKNKITLNEFYTAVKSSQDQEESYSTGLGLLSKMPTVIKADTVLTNFLVTTLIRGKIRASHYKINANSDYTCNVITYRFKKDNELHSEMYKNLITFLKQYKLVSERFDYDHYFYINVYNKILYNYVKDFKNNFCSEILSFSKECQSLFLKNVFKFTNNNFYTNPEIFHTLKEMCYNNKLVISYVKRSGDSKETDPICCSIVDATNSDYEIYPDVIYLDKGYLTRILDIKYCNKKHRVIKDYLIIG